MKTLSVKEYAELRGCSERYVRTLISTGKIKPEETTGIGGTAGRQYRIPLASIEPRLIKKYERIHSQKQKESCPALLAVPAEMEKLSESERREAAVWKSILDEWKEYRNSYPGPKAEADQHFEAYAVQKWSGLQVERQKLYRQKRKYDSMGESGLVDWRGKHNKHKKAIPDEVWDVFEYYYLDESQKTVAQCMRLTELNFKKSEKEEYLPLASASTFARNIVERIETPVLTYFRFGEKAFKDKCAPYITRYYEDLNSNDIWVCDNHTFDIFVNDGEHSKPVRLYLTGFLDVRSRKMCGWYVTDNPCSDATLYALRRGIERHGIPKRIYADNGREFLTHDIGGRGNRKSADWGHEAPTILEHLQIEFRTALVKNAKAKIIERAFREVKECFSRLFAGYTGGTTAERPERLKKTGKYAEKFTPLEDFVSYVDKYIEGVFNFECHTGAGMNGRTRNAVYESCLMEKRVATQDELNLMMLRNSKPLKVKREGVRLRLYDTYIFFNSHQLLYSHLGEKVYFRFNPDDLSEVRVYSEEDKFLCTAQQSGKLSYYATKEEVKESMQEIRQFEKLVRGYKKQKAVEAESELELMMYLAEKNLKNSRETDAGVVVPIRHIEKTIGIPEPVAKAVGQEEPIDYTKMLQKLKGDNANE